MPKEPTRCEWAESSDPLMVAYHDSEWGRPSHDDAHLFEMLTLEGAQAGLSWSTILRKREGYRRAFRGFDVDRVARMGARDAGRLMGDEGIVRNRAKIESTLSNARAARAVRAEHGSLDAFVWSLAPSGRRPARPRRLADIPAQTPASKVMSAALKAAGFRFVGPTTCYAFMQAVGMVDDHVRSCFRARPG